MASTLTWLDYSERDRRRAMQVIDLFREEGTRDELGLAGVRDSFAELFFPGTSTVQTRACYFLLVPWMFRRLEEKRIPSSKAEAWARREELKLNHKLLQGDDNFGVFGKRAGDALRRLPSDVYWAGLGAWGIRTSPGPYFRSLDGFYRRVAAAGKAPHDAEGKPRLPANWHPHLPHPPQGFPDGNISVALRPQDAKYLQDRIQASHPESLLAALARRARDADLKTDWPWQLSDLDEILPELRQQLHDAELFAVCMHGGALLYNLMLAELRGRDDWMENFRDRLHGWAADIEKPGPHALEDWKLDGVWRVARDQGRSIGHPTQAFVESWVENLKHEGPAAIAAPGSKARTLVQDREVQLKRNRARLTNRRYLELWGGDSGSGRLTYRWGAAKRILKDIFDGLAQGEGDAGHA